MTPDPKFDLRSLLHAYPLKYAEYDFPDLVVNVQTIEAALVIDCQELFVGTLTETRGERTSAEVVTVSGMTCQVFVGYDLRGRSLIFTARSLADSSVPEVEIDREINEFGVVGRVQLTAPALLRKELEKAAERICQLLRAAYLALEEAFVAKYLQWRFSLFDQIYALTNAHLKIMGSEELIGRYWYSLSNVKNATFRYQFDREVIVRAIAWLKSLGPGTTSPYQCLTLLITEEANDAVFGEQKFESHPSQIDDSTVVLAFNKLPHLRMGQVEFWVAEHDLYGETSMACIDVVTTAKISLQLNCPVSKYKPFQYALEAAADDVKSIFLKNYGKYEKDLRLMSNTLDRLRMGASGKFIKEVGSDIIAKVIKELITSS